MPGIGVIGDDEFTLGFRLAGIRNVYKASDVACIEKSLNDVLNEKNLSIVIIHDTDYKKLPPLLKARANRSVKPVVIPIGALDEEDIREKIKKAIGVDLYGK